MLLDHRTLLNLQQIHYYRLKYYHQLRLLFCLIQL
nr:MAG TPA: hypothetical protein [Caudoviricetes sp.]